MPLLSEGQGAARTRIPNNGFGEVWMDETAISFLQRLADGLPSMLAYWDRDLRCRYANRAYERWFGVSPENLIGRSLRDLLGPELFALNEPYVRAALDGRTQRFERVVPGPEGQARQSLAHYVPDIQDGQVVGFAVEVTEVTPLKRTEADLRRLVTELEAEVRRRRAVEDSLAEAEQSLAVALASVGAGFIATDDSGRVRRLNAVAEQLTGWSAAEALGESIWTVFEREGRPEALRAMNPLDVVRDRGITADDVHEVTLVSRQGERHEVKVRTAVTYGAQGTARGLAVLFRDETRLLQAAIESNLLAAIVQSSQDAIIAKTLDGRITSWNAAAQALFGYAAEEIVGRPIQTLIPADRAGEEMAILARLARGEHVPTFETVRVARDGSPREVSLTISPIRDAAGRIIGASKIVRDIAPQRRAQEARLRADALEAENLRHQETSRLKSLFLANMSHELRTPLNAIIGFGELLHAGTVTPAHPKYKRFVGHIVDSGRHLLQLINDVLDLSKIEAGKLTLYPEPVDMARLVAEVTEVMAVTIERMRLALEIAVAPSLGDCVLDPTKFKQVLYNYLSNAVKFTVEGGRIAVRVTAEDADHLRLEVQDSGIGIEASQLPLLFRELQQLDDGHSRRHTGTGLGLALTRRLVEAQGGSVGASSEPGVGSVFHAVLPRRPPPAPVTQDGPRCLVIEDDGAVQAELASLLPQIGLRPEPAFDGRQALQKLRAARYDAVTLDLLLPDSPGLGLLAAARAATPEHRAPVLGVTMPADSGRTASFAVADVIGKPLGPGELAAALAPLRRRATERPRVMVVDDDPRALDLMRAALDELGCTPVGLADGRAALAELALRPCDALVLDLLMPEFDGFELLDALHDIPAHRDTPVYVWTSMLLSEADYARLAKSASAILGRGGGALARMLETLRGRVPSAAAPREGQPR